MRPISLSVRGAEAESSLAPFQGALRLTAPPHCGAAEDQREAARRAQRQGGFEGFDGSASIVLDHRDDERRHPEGGGIVAAMDDRGMSVAHRGGVMPPTEPAADEQHFEAPGWARP
jgi:hypothetical protein